MSAPDVFGTEDQQALLRRGQATYELLRHDPSYTYYGRTVGLATPEDGDLDHLFALARAQGNSNYTAVPTEAAQALATTAQAEGYAPLPYDKWEGDAGALAYAREIAETVPLPPDVTLQTLDTDTPHEVLARLAQTALACGVLPISGHALRGHGMRSICIIAQDTSGHVVSVAASSEIAHPDHPLLSGEVWWGMLATDPTRRGERLALRLGAEAMLAMNRSFSSERFMTGVEPGNAASEAVCARMGLERRGLSIFGVADPVALKSGRMTK